MQETKRRIPLDQIICAIPAALYLTTPLLDFFINYLRSITNKPEYETFKVIPYLPVVIAGVLLLSLIYFFLRSQDKNIFRIANQRTRTFQTTLLLFLLYLGLVMMSIAVNGFTQFALHGHPYTKMSMWTYITNVLLYLFFSSLVYDERVKTFLIKLCCFVASAYALYSVLGHIFSKENRGLSATFHNTNHYGYYLAVSIAVTSACLVNLLSARSRQPSTDSSAERPGTEVRDNVTDVVIWCLLLIVQCVALAYNDTLGAWLAVIGSYIFLFFAYRLKDGKWNWYVLVPLILFLSVSVVSSFFAKNIFTSITRTVKDVGVIAQGAAGADKAGSGRWKIWKATVRHILERPLFGNGIEGLLYKHSMEGVSTGSPHNEFLEYMAFFGIPAGLAYIAGCVTVFIHGIKHRKELNAATLICMAGAFAYLVSSFFGVCFYYTVVYLFIFLGLSLNFTGKDRPAKPLLEQNSEGRFEDVTETVEPNSPDRNGEEKAAESN